MKRALFTMLLAVSLSVCSEPAKALYGDFNSSGQVDLNDLASLSDLWLVANCSQTANFDVDGDCTVNFREFSSFAYNWQRGPQTPVLNGRKVGNSVTVTDSDTLAAEYVALCARTDMPSLSATNRRVLLLMPGVYTLASTLVLNTSYIDITGVTGNKSDVLITGSIQSSTSNTALVKQTCADIVMRGISLRNVPPVTPNAGNLAHTFVIDVASNSASVYDNCDFTNAATWDKSPYFAESVRGIQGLGGTWRWCTADKAAWRVADNCSMDTLMYYCTSAGPQSFGGDQDANPAGTGQMNGTYDHCTAGWGSFGGCMGNGMDIGTTARFYDCVAGNNSYALDHTFAGRAYRCKGGSNCFAGGTGTSGKFAGYAEDCESGPDNCFGMNAIGMEVSGRIINCKTGRNVVSGNGMRDNVCNVVDRSTQASYAFMYGGNTITATARNKGTGGNSIAVWFHYAGPKANNVVLVLVDATGAGGMTIKISHKGDRTGTQMAALTGFTGDATQALKYISMSASGDGSWTAGTAFTGGATLLSGGIDPPYFERNNPSSATNCTESLTIIAFNNGHTFTNLGATEPIKFTLPPAIRGLKFTIVKATSEQNVIITAAGTDTIDGGMGGGSLIDSTTETAFITVECVTAGAWLSTLNPKGGTWQGL